MQGRVSPAWESISAPQHLFLLLANVCQSLTAYEVCIQIWRPMKSMLCGLTNQSGPAHNAAKGVPRVSHSNCILLLAAHIEGTQEPACPVQWIEQLALFGSSLLWQDDSAVAALCHLCSCPCMCHPLRSRGTLHCTLATSESTWWVHPLTHTPAPLST